MRRAVTGVALALLMGGGVACGDPSGGDDGGAKSLTALQAAARAVDDAGSSRVEMTMTMDAGIQVDATMEGAFTYGDPVVGEATVTMDAPDAPPGTAGLGEPTKIIAEGTFMYMKGPLAEAYGGSPTGWGRLDVAGMPGVSPQASQDPSQYIDFLRAAGGEPEEVGTEMIRGTETTHYTSEIEFEALLEQGGGTEEYAEQLADLGAEVDPVGVEVWIADDGLPRRMTLDMVITGVSALPGGEMTISVAIELFDFGVEVDLTPPKKFEELTPPAMSS